MGIYVNNLVLGSQSHDRLKWLKNQLMKDLSEAKLIIGWEIKWDLQVGTLKIDQKSYICNLLEAKRQSSCHLILFPIKPGSMVSLNQAGDYDQLVFMIYQQLIRKMLYLTCGTRLDIAFVVSQLSRYNLNPWVGYLHIANQVLKYLKGTITLDIK